MKLDEALEVLNEISLIDAGLRLKAKDIERGIDMLAHALVNKTVLEWKLKLVDQGEDTPEEIDRKARNATKNIFKSAAGSRPIKEITDAFSKAVTQEVKKLR